MVFLLRRVAPWANDRLQTHRLGLLATIITSTWKSAWTPPSPAAPSNDPVADTPRHPSGIHLDSRLGYDLAVEMDPTRLGRRGL